MREVNKNFTMRSLKVSALYLAFFMADPAANAASVNSYRVTASDNLSPGTDISASDSSTTGPVNYSSTRVAASADFGVLKARSSASSSAGTNPLHNESTSSRADTRFKMWVDPTPPVGGGSGLQIGDAVSLDLSFRLDGNLFASSSGGTGQAGARANLRVEDPNNCGEGCLRLMDFSANAGVHSGSGYSWLWSTNAESIDPNTGDLISTRLADDSGSGVSTSLSFSTGILSYTLMTTVGADLDIIGSLITDSTATWGASASSDFFNTFGLVVTSNTPGVELRFDPYVAPFDLGGGTVVPVPAAVWLFGSGLIGLIGVARRKKA